MMYQNTKGFSKYEEFMKRHYQEIEETCQEHGVNLIKKDDSKPFCPACRLEKNEQEKIELAEQMTSKHFSGESEWLFTKSIYSDRTFKNATFNSYETEDKETTVNKEKTLEIARDYFKGETYNTILNGKAGVGKSHLAMSMLKNVNKYSDPSRRCLFVSIDEMFRIIKDSFSNPEAKYTEKKIIDMLIKADLLVLDDLHAETAAIDSNTKATPYTVKTLYAIMNGRADKPTIITTNLNPDGIARMYDTKLASRLLRGTEGHIITFKETSDKRLKYS